MEVRPRLRQHRRCKIHQPAGEAPGNGRDAARQKPQWGVTKNGVCRAAIVSENTAPRGAVCFTPLGSTTVFARQWLPGLRPGLMNLTPLGSRRAAEGARNLPAPSQLSGRFRGAFASASCAWAQRRPSPGLSQGRGERCRALATESRTGCAKDGHAGAGKFAKLGSFVRAPWGKLGLHSASQRKTLTRPLPEGEEKDADAGNGAADGIRQRWSRWRGKVGEVGHLRAAAWESSGCVQPRRGEPSPGLSQRERRRMTDASNGAANGMRERWSRWRGKVRKAGAFVRAPWEIRVAFSLAGGNPHPASPKGRGERRRPSPGLSQRERSERGSPSFALRVGVFSCN